MKDRSPIGVSIPRLESADKVTGKLSYLEDLKMRGMLHTKVLRSPLPHARIVEVDDSRARKLAGVAAVLTQDTLRNNSSWESHYGPVMRDQAIVAIDRVRYVGDMVAAVTAERPEIAEEAIELIEVEYQELPAVYDPEEALGDGAPILHENLQMSAEGLPDLPVDLKGETNLCNHVRVEKGDVERGFAESDQIFEEVFTTPSTQHVPLETPTAIAHRAGNGRMTVWSTVQNPFMIRRQMAEIFHLPLSKVRVVSLNLGGGYGAKLNVKLEPIVGVLACLTRRPVGITLSREETFQTITKHAARIYLKTGTKSDGTILARRCRIYLNTGAYAEIGPRVAQKAAKGAAGPYEIPNVQIDVDLAYTNCIPAGA
ncbi:MAG: molybdopterin cofactor-binding domain-containing protein, partial [Acidobacteriota bacterium]